MEGKLTVGLRPFFFGAKLIGLNKDDGGVRPIAVGNTLRRICSKCVSSFAADQRQNDFHGSQFGCGTSRGAEIAAHVFRNLLENEHNPENVILKMDFKNAFNSLKRDKMLDTVFRKRRQIYNYTYSAYGEASHLFFGDKVIQSQEGCQQGDPEGPALFSDTIQELVNQMVSQYNIWYLDDGNFSDHYRTVLEDFKRIIASADEYGLSLVKTKCYLIFLGNCNESLKRRIKALFDEVCPGIKVEVKENLEILGSPMGANARRDLLNKKLVELQRLTDVISKLDAHYGFYMLKNCFSLPKLLYFLRTSPCFEEMDLLNLYDSIVRKSLSKICKVNFSENSFTQAILPVSRGGIGIASASQIALPAFLASATGAQCALSCILPENYVDASFEKALNLWLEKSNLSEAPSDFIQKHWTAPLSHVSFDQLITDLDAENVRRLNAYQDPFGSAWLNVVPSKNLGLKLTDQQLRISLSLRLGAKICEKHTCRCGKLVEENGHHGLSCARSAGRFSRHHNLNVLVKQALSSIKVPSILEPNGLTRSDGKRPDGITLAPWEEGKQLVWDVTCVDLLAPRRMENGSVANPGTAAEDAEELKTAKYNCLIDKGYIFQPLAFEIQGGVGPSTSSFLKILCKKLCVCNQENRAGSFFKQKLSLAIQAGNAASIVGTVRDEDHLSELYYL